MYPAPTTATVRMSAPDSLVTGSLDIRSTPSGLHGATSSRRHVDVSSVFTRASTLITFLHRRDHRNSHDSDRICVERGGRAAVGLHSRRRDRGDRSRHQPGVPWPAHG